MDDLVSKRRVGIPCKLDMEKTFDHVCWAWRDLFSGRNGGDGLWLVFPPQALQLWWMEDLPLSLSRQEV